MVELTLPYPPSVNHYWRNVRGMMVVSKQGRTYRQEVKRIISESGLPKITGAVAVKRILYCPDYRRRDEDNTVKAIYDALSAAGLWDDDSFVCAGMFEKRVASDGVGRVLMQIKSLTDGVTVNKSGAWLK